MNKSEPLMKYACSFKIKENGRFVRKATSWLVLTISKSERIFLGIYTGRYRSSRIELPQGIIKKIIKEREKIRPIPPNPSQKKRFWINKEAVEFYKKKFKGLREANEAKKENFIKKQK